MNVGPQKPKSLRILSCDHSNICKVLGTELSYLHIAVIMCGNFMQLNACAIVIHH